jgi:hypothetical protein
VPAIGSLRTRSRRVGARPGQTRRRAPRLQPRCNAGPPTITHGQLVASWRRALDAFGEALESDNRYLTPTQLKQLKRELSADRQWLEQFAALRSFP